MKLDFHGLSSPLFQPSHGGMPPPLKGYNTVMIPSYHRHDTVSIGRWHDGIITKVCPTITQSFPMVEEGLQVCISVYYTQYLAT